MFPMPADGNVHKSLVPPPLNEVYVRQGVKRKRGRPRGSRTKSLSAGEVRRNTIAVHLDEYLDEPISRGNIYSSIESIQVARAWVDQSRKGPQQREEKMWKGICAICTDSFYMGRMSNSIRFFWNRLSFEAHNYISVREQVMATIPSGCTLEVFRELFMRFYMKRAGKKDTHDILRE